MLSRRQWLQEKRTTEFDMINNMKDFMDMYNQMRQNPMQVLSQRFNLPQNANDPNQIIQHLLNTGQVTQNQVNQAMQLRSNPLIQKMFNMK